MGQTRDTIAVVVDVVLVLLLLLLWIGSTCSRLGFLIAMLDKGIVDDFEAIEALDDKMDCYIKMAQ